MQKRCGLRFFRALRGRKCSPCVVLFDAGVFVPFSMHEIFVFFSVACYNDNMENCHSFPPVYAPDARVLVLGSMPGVASLNAQQYYAHPRNAFWPIVFALWDEKPPTDYAARLAFLRARRVALWDVAAACFREGSLDSGIRGARPNDFAALFAACPQIRAIFFNGQAAWTLYHRLCPGEGGDAPRVRLPSTSPAYTMPFEQKLAAWRAVRIAAECEETL